MARISKTKFTSGAVRTAIGCCIALVAAVALTLWASFFVCLGLHAESITPTETVIPILGVLFGAAWCGYRAKRHGWWAGLLIGVSSVAFWFAAWCYLTGRFSPQFWVSQSLKSMTPDTHFIPWGAAVASGLIGGFAGGWFRKRSFIRWTTFTVLTLVAVPVVMLGQTIVLRGVDGPGEKDIAPGMTVKTWAEAADGTTARFITFDFAKNPNLAVGMCNPVAPNGSQNPDYVANRLCVRAAKQKRKLVCLLNGGFGPGSSEYSFGIDKMSAGAAFRLAHGQQHSTANCVRPLRDDGDTVLAPSSIGNTGLKCSRTSIGWSSDSKKLYVLIVRDPDGEVAGVKQQKSKFPQTGGWNVAKVEKFWEDMDIRNVVLLDSGDSTQLAYPSSKTSLTTIGSGYLLAQTIGYWRNLPLRLYVPMLPASEARTCPMSYIYILGTRTKD